VIIESYMHNAGTHNKPVHKNSTPNNEMTCEVSVE